LIDSFNSGACSHLYRTKRKVKLCPLSIPMQFENIGVNKVCLWSKAGENFYPQDGCF
jgi:hypothetical protein